MSRRRAPVPRKAAAGSQNLDSLLDTMANVVGILVVLMAVIQLTVGDAMDRIRALGSDEGRALLEERDELDARLAALDPPSASAARELARLRDGLAALLADSDATSLRGDAATAAAAQAAVVKRLEARNAEGRRRLAALRVQVEAREGGAAEALELRLPDPRPAPPGTRAVIVLVRHGRVLDPELSEIEENVNGAVREWVEAGGSTRGHGVTAMIEHVRGRDLGNEWLTVEMIDDRGRPGVRLEWRDRSAGDGAATVAGPGSAFRRALARRDPRKHFLQFFVWGDSFEPYLEARRIAEAAGFAVGWEARAIDHPLTGGFGRAQRFAPVD